jgi:hypothetical protein
MNFSFPAAAPGRFDGYMDFMPMGIHAYDSRRRLFRKLALP